MPKGKVITPTDVMNNINAELKSKLLVLGSDPSLETEYLPSGVLPMDVLLSGGFPRRRWTEIYGDFSTLKSFVAYHALACTQAGGGVAALIDTEGAYEQQWFRQLGGDPSRLIIWPDKNAGEIVTGEGAVAAMEAMLRVGVDMIVWDSIAATAPKDEVEKDPRGSIQPARLAALMSQATRRLNAANSRTAVVCLNQTRSKVGVIFGSSESIPGGRSLPFFASYRVSLRKAGYLQESVQVWDGEKNVSTKQKVGMKIKATLEKSKLSKPDTEAWMVYDLRTACLDDIGFLMSQGLLHDYIVRNKQGMWKWSDDNTWQSEEDFRATFTEDDQLWLAGELISLA